MILFTLLFITAIPFFSWMIAFAQTPSAAFLKAWKRINIGDSRNVIYQEDGKPLMYVD